MFFHELENPLILDVSGADATRYLNARLTNDIKILPEGFFIEAAALNHAGKCEGLYTVLASQVEKRNARYLLICKRNAAQTTEENETIIAAFKRYIVADRVNVFDVSAENGVLIIFCTPDEITTALDALSLPDATGKFNTLDKITILREDYGFCIAGEKAAVKDIKAKLGKAGALELSKNDYDLQRVKQSILSFPQEINENSLFSESGLVKAVSFKKGCYVGQEVVEKIDAYGKAPKLVKRLKVQGQLDANISSEVILFEPDGGHKSIGKVLTKAYDSAENFSYCFVSMRNIENPDAMKLSVDNFAATII